LTFWPNTYAYCKKVWFWFLNGLVLPGVFYRSIFDIYWLVNRSNFDICWPVNRSIPHISLHHVTRFEPITAAHFDQRYNNVSFWLLTVIMHLLIIDQSTVILNFCLL